MQITDIESKYRSQLNFNYNHKDFIFDVNPSLFSSSRLDKGTFHLIHSIKNQNINFQRVLDLGCGYGPLGIIIKKLYPESEVLCSDRDNTAIDYTKRNADLNEVKIKTIASLDYENIDGKFTLILSNYPAKAGINALRKFVYGASNYLVKNGILAIVIVKELEEDFKKIKKNEMNILYESKSKGHIVYHISFKEKIEFYEDIYTRKEVKYQLEKKIFYLKTAYNLAEFDSPSFSTNSIIKLFTNLKAEKIVILEPLQGHLALAVNHILNPKEITIVSRDLLSLKYTKENLERNDIKNFKLILSSLINENYGDLLIWKIEDDIELGKFNILFNHYKSLYPNIIISGKKSKINNFLKSKKIFRKAEVKNYISVLI